MDALADLPTAADVIDALGGLNSVSELTGIEYGAVWNWKSSGSFPARTYVVLTTTLRSRGYSAPASLWGMVPSPSEVAS